MNNMHQTKQKRHRAISNQQNPIRFFIPISVQSSNRDRQTKQTYFILLPDHRLPFARLLIWLSDRTYSNYINHEIRRRTIAVRMPGRMRRAVPYCRAHARAHAPCVCSFYQILIKSKINHRYDSWPRNPPSVLRVIPLFLISFPIQSIFSVAGDERTVWMRLHDNAPHHHSLWTMLWPEAASAAPPSSSTVLPMHARYRSRKIIGRRIETRSSSDTTRAQTINL